MLDRAARAAHRHNMRFAFALLLCCVGSVLHAASFLSVSSPTTNLVLSADGFATLHHVKVKLRDPHDKKVHRFIGVAVSEILARVGVPTEKLHGRTLRQIVIFRARDAYAVSFSLADFDADFSNRTILLADQEDGARLSDAAGPLRLIVSGDKEGARWVRMVTRIEIIDPDQKP